MKRILTFLLAAALLLTSLSCALSASAAAESSDWMTKLTNKTLIQVVEKEIGKGWTLYQPNPREEDTKMSSNSFLKNVKLYPVVARKDDAMQLIILKKVKGKWKVDVCNDKALTRPELTIRNFSMDENVSSSDTKYTVYFDYLDAEGKVYVLSLTLYTEFESMFDDLHYLDGGVWESPSISIEFINDRGFELYSYYSGRYTSTYHVYMYGKANFGVDEFQFADVPLQFSDLLTSAVCNAPEEGAAVYRAGCECDTCRASPLQRRSAGDSAESGGRLDNHLLSGQLSVHPNGIRQLPGITQRDCGALLLRILFLFQRKNQRKSRKLSISVLKN